MRERFALENPAGGNGSSTLRERDQVPSVVLSKRMNFRSNALHHNGSREASRKEAGGSAMHDGDRGDVERAGQAGRVEEVKRGGREGEGGVVGGLRGVAGGEGGLDNDGAGARGVTGGGDSGQKIEGLHDGA
ncbi:hypothetical protein R1sor_008592 [Riccia sorocarpa]|uniref:Uncharacterized protein n=1 Tax=Riccia sorocarpa TaxID=122646 RepID=A0ABD3HVZ0_9MARC